MRILTKINTGFRRWNGKRATHVVQKIDRRETGPMHDAAHVLIENDVDCTLGQPGARIGRALVADQH